MWICHLMSWENIVHQKIPYHVSQGKYYQKNAPFWIFHHKNMRKWTKRPLSPSSRFFGLENCLCILRNCKKMPYTLYDTLNVHFTCFFCSYYHKNTGKYRNNLQRTSGRYGFAKWRLYILFWSCLCLSIYKWC